MPAPVWDGQLPTAAANIVPAVGQTERVSVSLQNTSSSLTETVLLTLVRSTANGGATRRVARLVLAPNEQAQVRGIPLMQGDALNGQTSDATTVDYVATTVSGQEPFTTVTLDASGLPKSKGVAGTGQSTNNLSATTDPTATNDNTQGYAPGSVWINTTGQRTFECVVATTNQAVWAQQNQNLGYPRNLLDGGDFTVNPWQRGTSFTGITNTVTYGPDRFFAVGGASSSISLSQVADTTVAGFSLSLKFQRAAANSNTAVLNLGQVLESLDCIKCQGQQITLSFYARQGANYSGGALTVAVNHSTTAGNDTAAHLAAASTNWQAVPSVINTTQAINATMTRYVFTGTVPANITQLGLLLSWTPSGTAGADDSIILNGIQLEIGGAASPFEHRDLELELALCQRYYFQWNETNGANVAVGAPTGTNTQGYSVWLPTPMRVAPTSVTVTIGGLKVIVDGAAAIAVVGLTAGTAHSPTIISLTATNTISAAAHSILLQGSSTTGIITASADF